MHGESDGAAPRGLEPERGGVQPVARIETFVGRVDGLAVWPPRGTHGFGYDPMFTPGAAALTFGEMAPAEKRTLSHRARAFAQLMPACLLADAEPGEHQTEYFLGV